MITLTITAETPVDLRDQLERLLNQVPLEATQAQAAPGDAVSDGSPTNEDYRKTIKAIPRGKVAAYSVVSEVVRGDTAGSQKVAGLAANDATLGTAYRIVKKDGSIAAGFRWPDGRLGGPDEGRRFLEEEEVSFDMHGRVHPRFMLSAEELNRLCANDD